MAFKTAAVAVTATATIIYDPVAEGKKGNYMQPQLILVQNQDATNSVAIGGAAVTYGAAPRIAPGGNFEVRLESTEPLYAICDTAQTATVAYILTRT